jgi:hypothetical protein
MGDTLEISMPEPAVEPTRAPQKKVIAATGGAALGSAIAVILMWIIDSLFKQLGISMPDEVRTALTTVFTTISTFAGGYYTPPGSDEVVTTLNGKLVSGVKRAN